MKIPQGRNPVCSPSHRPLPLGGPPLPLGGPPLPLGGPPLPRPLDMSDENDPLPRARPRPRPRPRGGGSPFASAAARLSAFSEPDNLSISSIINCASLGEISEPSLPKRIGLLSSPIFLADTVRSVRISSLGLNMHYV
jgi:hypothetical protein